MSNPLDSNAVTTSSSIVEVQFNNQTLLATLVEGTPYVAIKPICENLGIDWEAQRQRIERHPVLNSTACMIRTTAQDGRLREMLMLPTNKLNGWLFGIEASRVNDDARDTIIFYQEKCFDMLADYFMNKKDKSAEAINRFIKPLAISSDAPKVIGDDNIISVDVKGRYAPFTIKVMILDGVIHVLIDSLLANNHFVVDMIKKASKRIQKEIKISHYRSDTEAKPVKTIPLSMLDDLIFEYSGNNSTRLEDLRRFAVSSIKEHFGI